MTSRDAWSYVRAARAAATLVLVLVALALAPGLGAAQTTTTQAGAISDLRVCGAAALQPGGHQCSRDQRGVAIGGQVVGCTASAPAQAGAPYEGRLVFDGQPFPLFRGTVPADGGLAVVYGIPGLLPAGRWRCELSVGGARVGADFRTAGGLAAVSTARACSSRDAIAVGGQRIFCRELRSAQTLVAPGSISCSATFARVRGKRVRIEFLRDGRPTGLEFGGPSTVPVTALGTRFFYPGRGIDEGRYACRFSIAGRPRALVRFRVLAHAPPLTPRQRFVQQGSAICNDFYARVRRLLGGLDLQTGQGLLSSFQGMYRIGIANTRRLSALRPPTPLGPPFQRALVLQRRADAYLGSLARALAALPPAQRRQAADRRRAEYNRIIAAPDPWYRRVGLTACVSG